MFNIIQPDSFALKIAETINRIGDDSLSVLSKGMVEAFREIFYDGSEVRPKADIRRILAAFERPAELFEKHAATVAFLLAQSPGILAPEDFTPPVDYTVNGDGSVTIPD
jgi:hypothetical protein